MSTRRKLANRIFGTRENHQAVPSPPQSPRPGPVRVPEVPHEERVLTSDDLQQSVESLELVLRTMDRVREQTNAYNASLREHARSLRGYAVGINMSVAARPAGPNVGEEQVYERVLVHCANYYDRLAESQEHLVPSPRILTQARTYLEEYNILNNYAAKYFKTLARDSSKLDNNLKELTKKLSKLTHKSAAPGSANTQNASTMQVVGPHESYVQRLTGLSGQIQGVRKDHLALYTRKQKQVDRYVGQSFARCTRQNYNFLADAIHKTGTSEGIGGVNAWGAFAIAGVSPPINDLEAETEPEIEEDWEGSYEDGEDNMSPRQIAQQQPPRPPSAYTNFDSLMGDARGNGKGYVSLNMQGKMPQIPSHQGSQNFQSQVSPLSC
jgi:hypothetical protein